MRRLPEVRASSSSAVEQPAPDAEPTGGLGDPHPLDLRRLLGRKLQPSTSDGLAPERRDEEHAGGWSEDLGAGGPRRALVEAVVETAVEFGEVGLQAVLSIAMCGIDEVDAHQSRGEQSLDFSHRRHESLLLGLAQRFEHRARRGRRRVDRAPHARPDRPS